MSLATVNFWFDSRKTGEGRGIVKWSVIHERKPQLFSTGCKITKAEWEFLQASKNKLDNRIRDDDKIRLWHEFYGETFRDQSTNQQQTGYLKRARNIIGQLGHGFTFEAFLESINNYGKEKEKSIDQTYVLTALTKKAASMSGAGRVGNADLFELAAKSLRRFVDSFTDAKRKEFLKIAVPRRKVTEPRQPGTLRFEYLTPDFLTTYE